MVLKFILPPSPGFVSMYRKFVYRLYHYSSVLLCTFARISKYIKEKELINFFLLPCFDSEGKSRKHKQKQTKVTQFFDKRCNCVAIDKGLQPRSLSALFFFSLWFNKNNHEYDNNRTDNYNDTNNDHHCNLLKCDWCVSCFIFTNHSVQL